MILVASLTISKTQDSLLTHKLAVSIYLAIYNDRIRTYLPIEITSAVEEAGLPASSIPALFQAIANGTIAALDSVPGMNENILRAYVTAGKVAQGHAFRVVYLSTLGFFAVGMIASFFVRDVGELLTGFVNKTIHKSSDLQSNAKEEKA